jgi:phospholipase C
VPVALPADLSVYGSNGFFRQFRGVDPIGVSLRYDAPTQSAVLTLQNAGAKLTHIAVHSGYGDGKPRKLAVAPGAQIEDRWDIAQNDHWYDFTVTSGKFQQRLAGHIETGQPSKSDPAIGRG